MILTQPKRWQWRLNGAHLFALGAIGLTSVAGAHDAGRGFVEAASEGLLVAMMYAPFFALCEIKVEPEPRHWKAASVGAIALWFGLLPALLGWVLDYYSSFSDALIAGGVFSAFWVAILIFGGRANWCAVATGICVLAAAGAWIAGLASLREVSVLGSGSAVFFVTLGALGGD